MNLVVLYDIGRGIQFCVVHEETHTNDIFFPIDIITYWNYFFFENNPTFIHDLNSVIVLSYNRDKQKTLGRNFLEINQLWGFCGSSLESFAVCHFQVNGFRIK